ncbi:MAG: pyrimidine 5'-nucleotidase [Pseudomonadota bacterium]
MAKAITTTEDLDAPFDAARSFAETQTWIFDLDNTLYPADCNLFAQVDRRMGEFIATSLGLPYAQARHLQKAYYYQYGTTLSGLMQVHKVEPQAFLDYVHDIDLSVVAEHPELADAIAQLPGRRLIFTNGSRGHAERVAAKLGVLEHFEDICSIETCEFIPKPKAEAFDRMVRHHDVDAAGAAMFEDMPHNLEVPHELGMTTVLVHGSDPGDHPATKTIKTWDALPEHIHHLTDDLLDFLHAHPLQQAGVKSRSETGA